MEQFSLGGTSSIPCSQCFACFWRDLFEQRLAISAHYCCFLKGTTLGRQQQEKKECRGEEETMYGKVNARKKIKRKKKWESSNEMKNEGGEEGRSREANKEQSNSME